MAFMIRLKQYAVRMVVNPWRKLIVIISPWIFELLKKLADWFLGDAVVSHAKDWVSEKHVLNVLPYLFDLILRSPLRSAAFLTLLVVCFSAIRAMSSPTSSRTESKESPESKARLEELASLNSVKWTERGSGEERKEVYENRPKLFLEYSNKIAAQYGMTYSGLFLKNDGGRAFNVQFEPEVRSGMTLLMDNPSGSIDAGNPYPVNLHYCTVDKKGTKHPMGGMLSGRIEHLFNDLLHEGEDRLTITIRCQDFTGHKFVSTSTLRIDRWKNEITSGLGQAAS